MLRGDGNDPPIRSAQSLTLLSRRCFTSQSRLLIRSKVWDPLFGF